MDNLQQFDPTIVKLAKTYHIYPFEWEDIAQELRLHLWERRDKYDGKRPYKDWAYTACKHKIVDLARYYNAQKRGGDGRKPTLSELIKEYN